jgi:hypothetical protein
MYSDFNTTDRDRAVLEQQAKAWREVYDHCVRLGMKPSWAATGLDRVRTFISDLHMDAEAHRNAD